MKFIKLVDGIKTENGYKFSDYSKPCKSDISSMANFMASTYTGELVSWRDENITVIDTVIKHLTTYLGRKDTVNDSAFDFFLNEQNVHWEYDSENNVFYSVWIENGEATGDVFKIESIKDVQEGQTYNEGIDVTMERM